MNTNSACPGVTAPVPAQIIRSKTGQDTGILSQPEQCKIRHIIISCYRCSCCTSGKGLAAIVTSVMFISPIKNPLGGIVVINRIKQVISIFVLQTVISGQYVRSIVITCIVHQSAGTPPRPVT